MSNLILTICSNSKRSNDEAHEYDHGAWKVRDTLSEDMMRKVHNIRKRSVEHITKPNREWQFFNTIPLNKALNKHGPDILQGKKEGGAIYLPALKRYKGRFYREFESVVGDVDMFIETSKDDVENHLLIVSGLYGLLTSFESIQEYECNVPEEPKIKRLLKGNDFLTELVIAYMKKTNINRLFDFMADDSYRRLIDWKQIKKKTGSKIFFSHDLKHEQTGINLLPRLGHAAGLLLSGRTPESLSDIDFEHEIKEAGIVLSQHEPEWIPAGIAPSKREVCAVWAIRMVANIGQFLTKEGVSKETSSRTLVDRIASFKAKNPEIGAAMDSIRGFRNDVVHKYAKMPGAEKIKEIRLNYKKISAWAEGKGHFEQYDVDY